MNEQMISQNGQLSESRKLSNIEKINNKKRFSKTRSFILTTYLVFWIALLGIGGVMALGADQKVIQTLSILSAWTPTIVFLLLFHKFLPQEISRVTYIKGLFKEKKILGTACWIAFIQIAVFALCLIMISFVTGKEISELFEISVSSFFTWFLYTLINGATGEELGWRGYLQVEFGKKYGIIKGSLLVGIAWSFWHWPLWFIGSGYTGIKLITYIAAFVIANVSAAVMIGICFDSKKNLFLPILIHFIFNFTACFYNGDLLLLLSILAAGYLSGALILSITYRRKTVTVHNV